MDLYSSGGSIQQSNQYSEAAREANEAATDFNNSLAAQLDEANTQLDEDAGENQALSLYKGGTSGAKLLAIAGGTKKAKDAAAAVKGAAKSVASADAFKFTKLAQSATLGESGGSGLLVASEDVRDAAESEQLASRVAPAASAIQTSEGILGGSVEVATSADAVRTGQFADLAGPGAKAVKGATESALDAGLESAGKIGVGAAFKAGVAGVGGGLDIYKDVKAGFKFDNNLQAFGNIGNIFGSGLEIAGALTSWTGVGLGVEALGAAISVGSTALETSGDIEAAGKKKAETEEDITSQQRQGVAAAATTTVAPRSN